MSDEAVDEMRDHMNRLRGNLFGAVEAVGWPHRREASIKALIRSLTYSAQSDLETTLREREDSNAR